MKMRLSPILMGLCGVIAFPLCAQQAIVQTPNEQASSQTQDQRASVETPNLQASVPMPGVKAKPPMYSYVSDWQFPRSSWANLGKKSSSPSTVGSILDKALADGTIIGYGVDVNLVHQPDAETHDTWWSSMSLAGLVKVQEKITASDGNTSATIASATKHWDSVYVSRYYNYKSGYYYDGCTHVSVFKLKESAPREELNTLARNVIVPVLEKQMADGALLGYQIDTLAIHTQAPGTFWIVYLTPDPEGLDTVEQAIHDNIKTNEAFVNMTDETGRRDHLMKSDTVYK